MLYTAGLAAILGVVGVSCSPVDLVTERFIRCPHCGLPHDAPVEVCPTMGLRIERPGRLCRRRRPVDLPRDRAEELARMMGKIVDRKYRIVAALGEGGMSAIYEAEHLGLDRRVAIKVLLAGLADDPEAIARLQYEAQIVSAIGHPNICAVLDIG
ncbi:MAG: hypothetical protein V2A73_21890, partial [Pseudomonadota bacterium]